MVLTTSLLRQLEDGWRRHNAPLLPHLRQGLEPHEIQRFAESLGFVLGAELWAWWGWHDGVASAAVSSTEEQALGPIGAFLTLEEAVLEAEFRRRLATAVTAGHDLRPQDLWSDTWIPIVRTKYALVVCDCADADAESSPTFVNIPEAGSEQPSGVGSLGQAVAWWVEALESGCWFFDAAEGRWDRGNCLIDREMTRLV